jgi:multidrug efflux system membrane fusion protein
MPKPPAILPPPSERQVAKIPENGAYPHEPAKPQQEEHDPLRYTPPKRLKLAGLILLCVFLAILAWGLISRLTASHQLAGNTQNAAIPVVGLINPQSNGGPRSLVLPGNVNAFFQAPIYAQVSGYLKQWNYDIGAPVRAGAVLAVVDTPNLDQQLLQAKANLASAMANEQLAASTARRWNALLAKDAVSQQDADEKNADLAARLASVDAARANVHGLQALAAFKEILAPFNGVVTARNTDVGALITVGGQTPLFVVDDVHRLRIYVQVPQVYSALVKPGSDASFTVPEYPGQSFTAQLTSNAHAIDPSSGSLLVQYQADNAAGMLHPGDYAQVHISLPQDTDAVMVPPSALTFRDAGMEVATLGPGNHVVMKQVTIGRDLGTVVEIASGLTHSDKVIDNPPDSLEQGDIVRLAKPGKTETGGRTNG